MFWTILLVQTVALVCVKLSFLYFYRRIFSTGHTKIFNAIITVNVILTLIWGISFFFAFLFVCHGHFSAWWKTIQTLNTHCKSGLDIELIWAISDFIMDMMIIFLPIPMVRSCLFCQFSNLHSLNSFDRFGDRTCLPIAN